MTANSVTTDETSTLAATGSAAWNVHPRLTQEDREVLVIATKKAWAKANAAMDGYQPKFGYRPGKPRTD